MQSSNDFIPYSLRPLPERPQIVFIGNSLTLHCPNHLIGWDNYHGMAATAEAGDYAHKLMSLLGICEDKAYIANFSCLEAGFVYTQVHLGPAEAAFSRRPDIVVLQLGDNFRLDVRRPLESWRRGAAFLRNYRAVLASATASGAKVLCVSTWWRSRLKDFLIQMSAGRFGATYVFIGDIFPQDFAGRDLKALVRPAVDTHPGDEGMQAIAERIWRSAGKA
jgi:hypothetical protein